MKANRREVMRTLAATAAGAAASSGWVERLRALSFQHAHSQAGASAIAAPDWKPRVLTPRQNDLVVTLTELIIPETDTPGARAALVNRFVDDVLHEAEADVRDRFVKGLTWIDARSTNLFKKDFLSATADERTSLLTQVSREGSTEERTGRDFFRAIKAMTINGYYTTEIGLRRELGDPGQLFLPQFEGCTHPEHQ